MFYFLIFINQKIEKLKDSMHLIDVEDKPKNKHAFFVDNHREAVEFDPAKQFNTHELLLNRKSNRLTLEQLEQLKLPDWIDDTYLKQMMKQRSKKYKELAERTKRLKSLRKLEETYDIKKVILSFVIVVNIST
jgi:U3 small nucleolar RNA-associated protein 11